MCKVMQHYEDLAEQRGIQKGIQQGIAQGVQTEKFATAQSMLRDGLPLEMIMKYTGLTAAQLQALLRSV